ncbi:PREDICTED: protein LAZY 1-like [Ipomoea nil]|uniref:protein LAZY 1-like n=1 Tax=Ipomoea nil TaxID=35883 RepID=UPI000901BCC3|nr:PREDICTED: protein LAZY 1-like [Ipomoea nil]
MKMKLLGWMHRKLKHNCNEAVKNRTSFDPSHPTYGFSGNPNTTCTYQKVIKETEEKPLNEVFHGFLSIGTLGGGSEEAAALFNSTDEPPTPTFPTSFEETTTQITDQDLKLITIELEKFLEAEEDAQSSKRSSYASIITLTDKTQQDSSSSPTLLLDCPLQKYFFGLSESDMAVKNEEEASLSEDLQEVVVVKGNDKKRAGKAQFAKNFMKKMLKSLNSNSKSKTHMHAPNESAPPTKNKFPKVLKMLKKKVHPERYIGEKGAEKDENRVKGSRLRSSSDTTGNIWFRQMISPEEEELIMTTSQSCSGSGRGGAFMENNGHWIKTDADYLVLEL